MIPTLDSYRLFHEGQIALSQVERNGIRISVPYMEGAIASAKERIREIGNDLRKDEIFTTWRKCYGDKTNLGSVVQLGDVLFGKMKLKCENRTATGRWKADEGALRSLRLPFADKYLEWKKLEKVRGTYLEGILREVEDGYLHPFFNLAGGGGEDGDKGGAQTYRGSGSLPNPQNIPNREGEMAALIRRAFIPRRKGNVLGDIDYGSLEFNIAACKWRDPGLVKYASDESLDIHRDMASQCFACPKNLVTKKMRYLGKNCFVFPILYGSYWKKCSHNLWEQGIDLTMENGVSVREHLAGKGIVQCGDCPKGLPPDKGTYEHHIRKVEDKFFEQFSTFKAEKERWWQQYESRGWFPLMTGFVIRGVYKRNFLYNSPIQGPAFHCLLQSIILMQKWLRKYRMKTKIVMEIHDSITFDGPEKEMMDVLHKAKRVMTVEVPRMWPWIIVPLKVEAEIGKYNWWDKEKVSLAA